VAKIKVKKLVDKKTISKVKELQLKIRYIDLSEKDMKKYLKEIDDLL
jgi:aspartyl-tRNA synthetase